MKAKMLMMTGDDDAWPCGWNVDGFAACLPSSLRMPAPHLIHRSMPQVAPQPTHAYTHTRVNGAVAGQVGIGSALHISEAAASDGPHCIFSHMSGGYSGTAQQSYAAIKARQLAPPVPVYIPGKVPAGTPVPPPNRGPGGYVAGAGRGATGFTTRSDIGPAKNEGAASSGIMPGMMPGQPGAPAGFGQAPAGHQAGRGRGQGAAENDNDRGDYSDANFDKFNGFSGSLFNGPVDAEDEAADNVWNLVEDIMDSRRKTKREAKERAEMEEYRRKVPTIQRQFADLKRQMNTMDSSDWLNIPEAGELARRKHKAPDRDFFTPVPDSLLDSARKESEINTSIDPRTGMMTPAATPLTDLTKIGEGRSKMLELKLQRVSDSVTGQTVVDPKGYLTGLNSVKISTQAEIGDFKEGRLLLNSAIQSNKNHAPSWIAAARLEVLAGKVEAARTIILDGCKNCPTSKDIWVEAAVLHPNDAAKRILAQTITHLPEEVAIWMRAAELESDAKNKRKVLRAALQQVPNSVRLWKAAVELEDETAARAMLTRAVEDGCCPLSVDLWLALAQLQPYEEARANLTRAREKLPSEPSIWLTAAKLEDANSHLDMVPKIIEKCLHWFSQQQIKVAGDRDHWLKEAETAESEKFLRVAEALISVSISIGVHTSDRKRIFIADAESMLQRDKIHCARTVYSVLLAIFKAKKGIWMKASLLEEKYGTPESLDSLLSAAVQNCPRAWQLWLKYAKEKWLRNDVDAARKILASAFEANSDNEEIWLAAVKLENRAKEVERARLLLQRARDKASTERVWMKSALFEREHGDHDAERNLILKAVDMFPNFAKLHMMLVQVLVHFGNEDAARQAYNRAVTLCPKSVQLWIVAAHMEQAAGSFTRARSVLERARHAIDANPYLWLETIRNEANSGEERLALTRMSQALQECPHSGLLWAEAIFLEQRNRRKARSIDAIKACENDPMVIVACARLFMGDRKIDKARTWFNRAVTLDPDLGDAWAHFYKFEQIHGSKDNTDAISQRVKKAQPRHGELWQSVSKQTVNWNSEVLSGRASRDFGVAPPSPSPTAH